MLGKLSKVLLAIGLLTVLSTNSFAAAAITPDKVYQERLGSCRLIIAYFSAGTSDDGDTWVSGLKTSPVAYWTSHSENPTAQTSVGVAVAYSAGTFTLYPAEDDMAYYLFVLVRN